MEYESNDHNTTTLFATVDQHGRQNRNIATIAPTESCTTPAIGQDLWSQLKRVQIPIFSGDKRNYPSWKAAFHACIDNAPVTPEYKMLQLRQYVAGEALNAIENLGHSSSAYEAAKDRLGRKYGGKRRQIAIFLEDLERFEQIQSCNADELERFADLLDLTVINLKEAGEHQDLGDGSLFVQLQRKLPQSLLARYHRWLYENNVTASVMTLRTWVMEESRFQTIASETINGLTGQHEAENARLTETRQNNDVHRTFFTNTRTVEPESLHSCQLCTGQHGIKRCKTFLRKDVCERWNNAKKLELCFRCLDKGHHGKSCRNIRRCGKDGCHKIHHRLLHVNNDRTSVFDQMQDVETKLKIQADSTSERQKTEATCSSRLYFAMEGNSNTEQKCLTENTENVRPVNTIDGRALTSNAGGQLRCGSHRSYLTRLTDHGQQKRHVFMEGNHCRSPVRELVV